MQVQLTKHVVELKDELNWGDAEELKAEGMSAVMMSGIDRSDLKKMAEGRGDTTLQLDGKTIVAVKYKAAELLITKITEQVPGGVDKVVPFSKDWMRNLSIADGNLLDDAITALRQGAGK